MENNTAAHKCVQFSIIVHIPPGNPAQSVVLSPPTLPPEHDVPIPLLASVGEEALVGEVSHLIAPEPSSHPW